MAGISGYGMSGVNLPKDNRIGGVNLPKDKSMVGVTPPSGDQVTLEKAAPIDGSSGINSARAIMAAGTVTTEQPFSPEWGKTFLNGPGNMRDGFKTVSGENLFSDSKPQPTDDIGHGTHGRGISVPYPGRAEVISWEDGTTSVRFPSDVAGHERGHAILDQMDWNITK